MSAEVVTHPAVGAEDRRGWSALAVIVTAQFMVVLDVAIVNVALPSIKTDLLGRRRLPLGGAGWWVARTQAQELAASRVTRTIHTKEVLP